MSVIHLASRPPWHRTLSILRPFTAPYSNFSQIHSKPPPQFPIIQSCPHPTCGCAVTPPGLDIDGEKPLNGTMPAHAEQVLISTGRDDWASRIEEDDDAVLVKGVRELMGRGGKFGDPFHNVMLTHSSFTPSTTPGLQSASAYLFPSFRYVSSIPLEPRAIQAFVQGFLLPNHLHSAHELLSDEQKVSLLQKPEMQEQFEKIQDVKEIIVLICGHGGRDERCGTMGPLLCSEFERIFLARGVDILKDPPSVGASEDQSGKVPTARVGLISHIGGHKFAGNVIIYIPPSFRNDLGESSALGGKGIWYGRVEPKHVEGIVHETIFRGSVIQDLFRGGVGQGGEILRI